MDDEGWSSECESGWTMYLDHSFERTNSLSAKRAGWNSRFGEEDEKGGDLCEEKGGEEQGEEENLSMISDASSGPPHFHEEDDSCFDENGCFFPPLSAAMLKRNGKRRIKAEEAAKGLSFVDDNASSHAFHFSQSTFYLTSKQSSKKNALDFSIGFSATNFKKKYETVGSSEILHKPTSAKPGCGKKGRRNKIS